MIQRWLYALTTGFTFVFFSEILFWGARSLTDFLATWLLYTLIAYLALALIAHFQVNTLWSLFLVGALYGWLTEGVVVATLYEELPISIVNTALSWHGLITVLVGWCAVRRALLASTPRRSMLLGAGIGLFWGAWIPFWAFLQEPGIPPATLARLALWVALGVPALALSYWLQNRLTPSSFAPHRLEFGLLAGLFALQFLAGIAPTHPVALLVMPLLLLLAIWGLRRHRRQASTRPDFLVQLAGPIPLDNLLGLLLMAPAAMLGFLLVQFLPLTPFFHYAVYLTTTLAGAALFALSLAKLGWPGQDHRPSPSPGLPGPADLA